MKTSVSLCIVLAVAIAGCASPAADPTPSTSTPTPTPTATATPTPSATPTPTPTVETPPAPMECHGDYVTEDSTATRLNMTELTFTIQEPSSADPCYAFVGPANATAGWNVITLVHPGQEFHIMPMYFIGTHTMADFGAAMAVVETQGTPEWAVASGAVGGVTGGQNGSVAIDLQAGNYVYFCPIAGHMFQGMMGMLAVENATENETMGMEPMADVSIMLVDYNFTIPNMSANVSVIKVTNNGTEDHEMPLVLLAGNATAMEFIEAIEAENPTGPPPGALVGGVNAIAPGQTVYVLRDLAAGERYGVACFVASPAHGGAPHIAIGPMVAEFEVA